MALLKIGTFGVAGRGAAGCVTGGGVCVACGADADSGGTGIWAEAVVAVAMMRNKVRLKPDTTAVRLKADTTFGEQITRTLPFN